MDVDSALERAVIDGSEQEDTTEGVGVPHTLREVADDDEVEQAGEPA